MKIEDIKKSSVLEFDSKFYSPCLHGFRVVQYGSFGHGLLEDEMSDGPDLTDRDIELVPPCLFVVCDDENYHPIDQFFTGKGKPRKGFRLLSPEEAAEKGFFAIDIKDDDLLRRVASEAKNNGSLTNPELMQYAAFETATGMLLMAQKMSPHEFELLINEIILQVYKLAGYNQDLPPAEKRN